MIHAAWATLFATAAVAIGEYGNRRVIGWLPDDPPRPGRKQHARPMPLAGVLIAPVILAWLVADEAWLPGLAIVLATTVGFLDDRRKEHGDGLDWRIKAVGLAAAAALAASNVASAWHEPGAWCVAFGLIFVLVNAVNFLDNTDGVTASLAAVSLLWLGQMAGSGDPGPASWVAAAGFTALGFLPWNWPRPRVFLGDAGAYTLGIAVGCAAAEAARVEAATLLAVAVPLADFLQVVTARTWLGFPPWVGDRRHLTHIVRNLGLPGWAVAPLFALVAWLMTTAIPA